MLSATVLVIEVPPMASVPASTSTRLADMVVASILANDAVVADEPLISACNVTLPVNLLVPFTSKRNPASAVVLIPTRPFACTLSL